MNTVNQLIVLFTKNPLLLFLVLFVVVAVTISFYPDFDYILVFFYLFTLILMYLFSKLMK